MKTKSGDDIFILHLPMPSCSIFFGHYFGLICCLAGYYFLYL